MAKVRSLVAVFSALRSAVLTRWSAAPGRLISTLGSTGLCGRGKGFLIRMLFCNKYNNKTFDINPKLLFQNPYLLLNLQHLRGIAGNEVVMYNLQKPAATAIQKLLCFKRSFNGCETGFKHALKNRRVFFCCANGDGGVDIGGNAGYCPGNYISL